MYFATCFALLTGSLAVPLLSSRATACDAIARVAELDGVAPAFSDITPGATANFLQQLPLKPDAQLIVYLKPFQGFQD